MEKPLSETSPVISERKNICICIYTLALVVSARRDTDIISAHISPGRANHTATSEFKRAGNYNLLIARELGVVTKEGNYLTYQEFWMQKPYSMLRDISQKQQWLQQGDLFLPRITEQ